MDIAEAIYGKQLIVSSRVCSPICFGGLNLVNIFFWNRATTPKTYWALENKEDRLGIKWNHAYYIKEHHLETMNIPKQACWMVKKIMEARKFIAQFQPIKTINRS